MDLTYTQEYLEFEKKVEDFCLNYKDINIANTLLRDLKNL